MLTNCSQPPELLGGLRCPAVIVNQKSCGQSKIAGGAARWTAVELGGSVDFHFSPFASQREEIVRIRGSFDGHQGIREWETQTTFDPGWRLQCEPVRSDRLLPCGIPRPRTLVDTNDSLRARPLHTMVTELDLTVTNTWMNVDTEQELFTRSSWSNPEDSLTQMDFIMTSRKLEMKHVQMLDSDWYKTDHRAVLAVLSLKPRMRYTLRNGMNLRGWEPDEAWLSEAAESGRIGIRWCLCLWKRRWLTENGKPM